MDDTFESINGCRISKNYKTINNEKHYITIAPNNYKYYIDEYFFDLIKNRYNGIIDIESKYSIDKLLLERSQNIIEPLFYSNQPIILEDKIKKSEVRGYNPLVSIIIVNWNGEKHLEELLSSIQNQSYKNYEIIIVDNNSNDNSINLLNKYANVKLLCQDKNYGFCKGNNIGISHSTGSILFLLNNDTVIDNCCIENAVNRFSHSEKDTFAVYPKILFYDNPKIINCKEAHWNYKYFWRDNSIGLIDSGKDKSKQIFGGIFAGIFIRKEIFEKIGLFDESFFTYGEDFDVCYRANLSGYKIIYEPASVVYHKYRSSSGENTNIYFSKYYFIRNYLLVVLKNLELKNLVYSVYRYFRIIVLPWAKKCFISRDIKGINLLFKVFFSTFMLSKKTIKARIKNNNLRRLSDKEITIFEDTGKDNMFYKDNIVVLSLLNVKTSFYGNDSYNVNDHEVLLL